MAQTYTVAQALQTTATGITVADSPANIAAAVGNSSLVSRVIQFTMIGDDAVSAYQAEALSTLGGKFTRASYNLTVRDTVASLTDAANAQGLSVGNIVQVVDTIENILASLTNPVIHAANAISVTDDATLTRAQLLQLETYPSFDMTGHTIVMADSAANLLAITPDEVKPAMQVYAVCVSSTVNAADAATLYALPNFLISVNVNLTVADNLANINNFVGTNSAMVRMIGVLLSVVDSTAHLISGMATLASLMATYTTMTATLASSETVTSAQLASLASIAHFSAGAGNTLTVADSMANLLALTSAEKALVQAAHLLTDTTATAAQVQGLSALPGFSAGTGNHLQVSDTADHIAGLTAPQAALLSAITVDDTVAGLVASLSVSEPAFAAITSITAHLDGGNYTLAQLAPLADQAALGHVTLVSAGQATSLNVTDTLQHLASGVSELDQLNQATGSVTVTATDDHSILSASAAASLASASGFDVGAYTLAVSDTGAAITAVAATIFQHGFQAITVTSGTFSGTVAELLDPALHFIPGSGAAAQLSGDVTGQVVTAAQLTELLALPNFDGAGLTGQLLVEDNAATLLVDAPMLEALPAGLTGHVSMGLSADATVSVSQAAILSTLAGFSLDGHSLTISDTGLNIAAMSSDLRALATSIQVIGGSGAFSVADFMTLTQASNFASSSPVSVSDSAVNLLGLVSLTSDQLSHISSINITAGDPVTAAQAEALSTLPNVMGGTALTIVDSAADLLQGSGAQPDNWAGELLASHITLTGDAVLTAAQAEQLAQLGMRLDNGGHAVTLQDSPAALLAAASMIGPIAGQITATTLSDNATPWAVTIVQAQQLSMLPNFQTDAAHAVIADNPANILAPINAAVVAGAPSVTLDGDYTVSVQTAEALHGLAQFSLGTHGAEIPNQLTISDGAGHLATLDPGTAGMAAAIELQGNSIVSVVQFDALAALPNFTTNGKLLLISDTAANLLTLTPNQVALASAIMVAPTSSDLTLTGDQAQQLVSLPGFTPGIAQIGVLDTAAHLLQITGAGPMPDDWAGELAAGAVVLSQDGTVTASQAAELALLGSRFSVGGHVLTVSDNAAQLIAIANAPGLALAGHIQLAGDEMLTAANATRLADVAGLDKAGSVVTVVDSAANLAFAGYAGGVTLADHVELNAATSLSATGAEALIGLSNFQVNPSAQLTITDTFGNLLTLAAVVLPNNNAVLQDTPIALSADAVVTVAQMTALAALPEYAQFSLNGHTLTIADSGRHLATYTPDSVTASAVYELTGDATLTAAQADHLAGLGVQLQDNMLVVADTPAELLNVANSAGLQLADALVLSGNASVSATQAAQLTGLSNFSDGGHTLTVNDTAQALIGLDNATLQMANALSLSDTEAVDVNTLRSLTQFGMKFSVSMGNSLSVADTAAHLAALNDLETALTTAQVLNADATVTGSVAAVLAVLPNFALGTGVHLTVQDTVANLIALPQAVQAVATAEELPDSAQVTISVADAAALAALPHFSNSNASITVDDSIAALSAADTAGWQTVSTQYVVTDSYSNLLSNPNSALLTNASGVQLLGDTQVDAASFAQLVAIPHFEAGGARITVVDGPAAIAANATAIGQFASIAQVNSSTPVSAADAELLAGLEGQGILSFATGAHLVVQDSYAALTLAANADGLGLANTITVLDTVDQLTVAMQHDWNGQNPYYDLSADGTVTGADLTIINAHSSHFSLNGHTLSASDTASDAIANAAAFSAMGLTVAVSDTIADVSGNATGLVALGSILASVTLTDQPDVTATVAASLAGLSAKLGGLAVMVADSASAVDSNLVNLQTLSQAGHLGGVHVTDTAAAVAAVASDLASFGAGLVVTLSGSGPIDALTFANLHAVASQLDLGTIVDVSDTGANLAGLAATLVTMQTLLGTVTISDGTAVDASIAGALTPLDAHLGSGVQLTVEDSAANLVAVATDLQTLQTDTRLAAVVATTASAADVVDHSSVLAGLHAQVMITDDGATISADLDALQAFLIAGGQLDPITLSSGTVTVSLQQIATDAGVLASLPYNVVVSDTAQAITDDLASGSSVLLADLTHIDAISTSDAGTVALTGAELLNPQIDGDSSAFLAKFAGSYAVTAQVAQLASIAALPIQPLPVAVVDTTAAIGSDLAQATPSLVANLAMIGTITADGGTITLTEGQALASGVDDGSLSVFAKLGGTATLAVTNVLAADAGTVAALFVAPTGIAIDDTIANVAASIATLAANYTLITGITLQDTGTLVLTEAQATAAHVADTPDSVLAHIPGLSLAVTGATVAQLATLDELFVHPVTVTIADQTANIQADLQSGTPTLIAHQLELTSITGDGNTLSLTTAQFEATDALLTLVSNATLQATGAAVTDIATLFALARTPDTITVVDTAANIEADLVGSTAIMANIGHISSITATGDGMITLASANVLGGGLAAALADFAPGTLQVTGAAVTDIPTLVAIGAPLAGVAIYDSSVAIETDLQLATPHMLDYPGLVTGITFTDGTPPTLSLTLAELATDTPLMALIQDPYNLTIADSTANLQTDLQAGATDLIAVAGHLTGITGDAGTISLTYPEATAVGISGVLGQISNATLTVTGVPAAGVGTVMALPLVPTSITVTDTAAGLAAELANPSSALILDHGSITAITVTDGPALQLTAAEALTSGVADSNSSILGIINGVNLSVTGATAAQVGQLATLSVQGMTLTGITVSDTAADIQADNVGANNLGTYSGLITSVEVTNVAITDLSTISSLPVTVNKVVVTDTPTNVGNDLSNPGTSQLVANIGLINSIVLSPSGTVSVAAAGVENANVLTILATLPDDSVVATGLTVSDVALAASLGAKLHSMDVSDTALAIQTDITTGSHLLLTNIALVTGVAATSGSITLTAAQIAVPGVDDSAQSVLALLSGAQVTVTGVAIADLAALMALPHAPDHVTILDTAANIAAQLTGGLPDLTADLAQITGVTVSDSNSIHLTMAQALAGGNVATILAVTTGTLEVSGVDIGSLASVAAITHPTLQIDVSDTAANIVADLSGTALLASKGTLLHDVHATDGAISLTVAEVTALNVDDGAQSALAHLSSGLIVTGAQVSDLATLAGLTTQPTEVDISDTSAHIQSDLTSGSALASLGVALGILASNDASMIVLTDTQATSLATVLAHLFGAPLEITGVPVADIAAMAGLTGTTEHLLVVDTEAAIAAAAAPGGAIALNAGVIDSVSVTDGTLGVDVATANYDTLSALGVAFDVSNLNIDGSASQLLAAETGHAAMLSAALSVQLNADALGLSAADATALHAMNVSVGGHQLTITDTGTNLVDPAYTAGVALASAVTLSADFTGTAAQATALEGLTGFNLGGHTITVQDTPANLLNGAYASGIAAAGSVALSADSAVNAADLASLIAITNFTPDGHQITLQDTASNILGASPSLLAHANVVDVADSAANILTDLSSLPALLGQSYSLAISVSGAAPNVPSLAVSAADYTTYQTTLDKVDMTGILQVSGSATELATLATTLHNDIAVGEVDVNDTANNILANLPALEAIGAKFSGANLSNATVNAAAVAALLSISNVTATNLTILDTGTQIAAAITANGAAAVTFMDSQTVQLSADSVVTAGDAKALESISSLNKNGYLLSVWDTATHLTDSIDGYLTAVSNASVDHVYLRTIGGTATVTASTASSLFTIPQFNTSNPDTTSNSLVVQDTAAHINSAYASLSTHVGQLTSVVVSGSATVTDAVFANLLALNATKLANVDITVRDTAANIIAGAPGQISGSPSITPLAWMLSGSATVDEAGMAQLGSLPGFNAGAYTLALSANATIGISDANAIGNLGSAYRAGGHVLTVAGTVADVLGLTTEARAIVVPDITDTFGNIAQLTPTSGLLGGTITVTDSESVTVAQAAAFLALLQVGGGSGIPVANVNFGGNIQTVTDTLANIQTLTGAAAWQQNASVQADFGLAVADTVAHLVDPANESALATMASTTLLGNQTASAADAESLFAVENAIHFNLGANVLTVQDTAANLLNPVYLDGVDMASVLLLSGSDTVSAADAEALMALTHFQIVNPSTILTISDSSEALLDGTLATALAGVSYAAQIEVQLSSPETLDAQTAHRLVNLAHFIDNGDLSIQDSSSYLLSASNLDAEQAATSVTLAGDETVSAATAAHLAAVPHFNLGSDILHLASNDFADAATLKTLADFGAGFDPNGHTLTITQDVLNLTPDEYAAVQADNIALNGHAVSAIPVNLAITATGGSLAVDGTGVDSATVTLYDASGGVVSTVAAAPTFHVAAVDTGVNMVLTETVGASAATSESAPVVMLEQASLEGTVNTDGATFATSGAVHVAGSEYLDLYSASAAPANPVNPVLVYDATQHTLSLDVTGHAAVVLVTLGTATHAASLDASEIFVKHQIG